MSLRQVISSASSNDSTDESDISFFAYVDGCRHSRLVNCGNQLLVSGLPNRHIVILTDCDELSRLSKLFNSSNVFGMESSKLVEWLCQGLSFFLFLVLFFFLVIIDGLCLNVKVAENTGFCAHSDELEAFIVVHVRNAFCHIRLSDFDVQREVLIDILKHFKFALVRVFVTNNDLWELKVMPQNLAVFSGDDHMLLSHETANRS